MNEICKICGSQTRPFLDKQFKRNYYHCDLCDFISRDENTLIDETEELEIYNLHNNSYEDQGYTDMFRRFLDATVMPYVASGKDALEFGSGPEPVLTKILNLEYDYKVDIYDYYYSPEKVYLGKTYDLITCTEVIEHLKEPLAYFEMFKGLLKSGGVIGLMTLFHPKDDDKFGNWWYRRDDSHISFFTQKTIEYIGKKLDLELLYSDQKRCFAFRKR